MMPDVDPHTLTTLINGGASLVGGALGVFGLVRRVRAVESRQVEQDKLINHLTDMVDALHRRFTAWGAPEHVAKTPPPPEEKPHV